MTAVTAAPGVASRTARPFLTAQWRWLAMLNYEVDPALLEPLVPARTELDAWRGRCYVSVVGFLFLDTRVLGVPVPWHRDFEEVNLRFYVRRMVDGERRRGVTFVRELVPRRGIAIVARLAYNEPYRALPMAHSLVRDEQTGSMTVEYRWRLGAHWGAARVEAMGEARAPDAGSEEEFIAEHYWGYTAQRDGRTIEYRVEHPRWRIRDARRAALDADVEALYGPDFATVLGGPPHSAFLADGSPVAVHRPACI